jgi:hypothetical protein
LGNSLIDIIAAVKALENECDTDKHLLPTHFGGGSWWRDEEREPVYCK